MELRRFGVAALFLVLAGTGQAGTLLTGKTIEFQPDDFTFDAPQVGQASLQWGIWSPVQESNTEIYTVAQNVTLGGGAPGQARIGTASQGNLYDQAIVWKIKVPDSYMISSFTWGFDAVRYRGDTGGDTTIGWQYSTNGNDWEYFSPLVTLNNTTLTNWSASSYTVNFETPVGPDLYIRILKDYNTSGALNAFYVYSNYGTDGTAGGLNDNSFIRVTVVPEPSTIALLTVLGTIPFLVRRGIAAAK